MLIAATDSTDPASFRESEIFKRCVKMGIIPSSLEDLEKRQTVRSPEGEPGGNNLESSDSGDQPASSATLHLNLKIEGMWCPACAWVIEETLNKEPGIDNVKCLFTTDHLKVEYNPVLITPQRISDVIAKLGYHGTPPEYAQTGRESRREAIRLGIAIFLTMNIMMLSFALYTGFFTEISPETVNKITWPLAVMATFVFIYCGAPIHRKAVAGLSAAAPGMEALISIGASSAFFYSFYNWVFGSIHLYFDTASMLITLVLIGKTIEQKTKDKISAQIGSYFDLLPTKVRLCTERYPQGRYVDAQMLAEGDTFRVVEGEVIPADGRILEGDARIDESSLTGEARPIQKQAGDSVSSGTMVIAGALQIKALSVGSKSVVGQLIAIIEQTLDKKTRLEDTTDKALRYFVPAIVSLAIVTAIVCLAIGMEQQLAIIRAVTVLVISCPCALGVAIPLARVFGLSLAGQKGILVHRFSAFEQIQNINAVVFDKTGTLTKGKWELIAIEALQTWRTDDILSMAAGLEEDSDHYVGETIVQTSKIKGIKPAAVNDITTSANGITGFLNGMEIKIGSAQYLSNAIDAAQKNDQFKIPHPSAAVSHVYMAIDHQLSAVFVFGDALRKSSPLVVNAMNRKGLKLAIVSGDGVQTTRSVGALVNVTECHGGMLPDDKSAYIENLKRQGYSVAMIGDGVNDVPALAAADLGIAVHAGRQIGVEASGITLMGNDPKQILTFQKLAYQISKTIRQNLVFTFVYNIISIPLAMSGLLNPLIAVSAMLLSSLSVTGNTLLLGRRARRLPPDLSD